MGFLTPLIMGALGAEKRAAVFGLGRVRQHASRTEGCNWGRDAVRTYRIVRRDAPNMRSFRLSKAPSPLAAMGS